MLKNKVGTMVIGAGVLIGSLSTTAIAVNAQSMVATVPTNIHRTQGIQNLTDAQKAIMQQAKDLSKQGKNIEAKKLLSDNNIKRPMSGKHKSKNGYENRPKIEASIVAGDYTAFKLVAVNSPLANLSQDAFKSLQAPTVAKKQAEDSISAILKSAGVVQKNRIKS